jgi:hypothetical protein
VNPKFNSKRKKIKNLKLAKDYHQSFPLIPTSQAKQHLYTVPIINMLSGILRSHKAKEKFKDEMASAKANQNEKQSQNSLKIWLKNSDNYKFN